ncbi:MAG TPA: nucleotide-binding protein [Candidatus Omnitrophota bacterium]|nr:nucleotide-binding protein [Candidatus Omnitrophota bacterium]HPB67549.1 nucleotide-binding protein [Candidatus Omnitrophota bacterium]HQO59050.1 nucleotide-binding protein [Candidatus Omnitrophota bacterium]HQP12729.1 nucleotide-binding protein [Candidatus Omnitrophota bacterium]
MPFLNFFKKYFSHPPQPAQAEREACVPVPEDPKSGADASPVTPEQPVDPLPEENGATPVAPEDSSSAAPAALETEPAQAPLPEPSPLEPAPAVKASVKKVYFLGSSQEKLNQRLQDELKKMGFSWIDLSAVYMERALDEIMRNNPDVFFSVVVLSGDEFVYDKNGKPSQARVCSKQDIVFKLGYLIGHYGKSNCFVLYKEQKSFALPTSLIHGIFTVLDDDVRWRDMLRSRLVGAGYSISC